MRSNAIHILNHNSVVQVINSPKFSHKDTLHGEELRFPPPSNFIKCFSKALIDCVSEIRHFMT